MVCKLRINPQRGSYKWIFIIMKNIRNMNQKIVHKVQTFWYVWYISRVINDAPSITTNPDMYNLCSEVGIEPSNVCPQFINCLLEGAKMKWKWFKIKRFSPSSPKRCVSKGRRRGGRGGRVFHGLMCVLDMDMEAARWRWTSIKKKKNFYFGTRKIFFVSTFSKFLSLEEHFQNRVQQLEVEVFE